LNLLALDLDGTLEDSRADMVAAAHRVREELGLAARDDAAVRPWVNKGMPTLYERCFDDHLLGGDRLEDLRVRYEADYLAHIADQTRLYDGIETCLERLASMGTLVLVTNKPEHLSRALLAALGVDRHFAAVVGGDTCAMGKPDPIMLRTAEQHAGFDPAAGRLVMVGDSAGDIRMARAHGARVVWCAWGYADAPGPLAPDGVAEGPGMLPAVVAGLLG